MENRIYFDNASTTVLNKEVLQAYEKLLKTYFANSESLYEEGVEVSKMLEKARSATAGLLGVNANEILFTCGSSEANSMAIKGVSLAVPKKKHIVTTQIEHSSTMNSCAQMERLFNYRITYLPVNEEGKVSLEDVKEAVCEDTVLVSIMHVNNETGSINPIEEIAEYVKKKTHAYMHVDLTQSIGKIPCDLKHVDLASISAHKLEGLKGSGILMKKQHVPMEALISGGDQEFGLRGGTSNAFTNMVFAKTLRLALENGKKYHDQIKAMQDRLKEGLSEVEGIEFNSPSDGLYCTLNFSYEAIPSEVMQNALNKAGFMVSARSTCEASSNNPSYVLKAMGFSDKRASSCIRVCLSYHNTMEEVELFIQTVKDIASTYEEVIIK